MKRRDFLKYGGAGLAGLAFGGFLGESAKLPLLLESSALAEGRPWRFGVMADTQWRGNHDAQNPGTVAAGIIRHLNQRFIAHDVKFVIQVGDLVDKEVDSPNGSTERTMPVRAAAAQELYDAGIGFFPLRGNHEGSQLAATEFQTLYPQARGLGDHLCDAGSFSSPFPSLDGLSYSFDFRNVRFVLLDQFTRTDGSNYLGSSHNNILDQLDWIDTQLSTRQRGAHAFVFSHKNLIGQNHADCLFGANPASNIDGRNEFIRSLQSNNVRYCLGGHDHMHHRSIVLSPDGSAAVEQIICSSNSYKFYIPLNPSNDDRYNIPAREKNIAQELFTLGYYIFTVQGPLVSVDYYSTTHGQDYGDLDLLDTPEDVHFYLRESFGYSLNGKEFLVAQGGSYTVVEDRSSHSVAKILSGTNEDTEVDYSHRPFHKTVKTGWSPGNRTTASDVFSLWGMARNLSLWDANLTGELPNMDKSNETDVYTLSLSYDHHRVGPLHHGAGCFGIAARDSDGKWVNAVDLNFGGTKRFVRGPWKAGCGLGAYGLDHSTKTAWAVLNHEGDFAVARELGPAHEHR